MSSLQSSLPAFPGRGTARAVPDRISRLGGGAPAPVLMVAAMVSFQLGAAVATSLFSQVGIPATAFLRNSVGGLLLFAIARPSLRRPAAELAWLLLFGVELALMNLAFYEAIQRIPLGVAVTVEFIGPLSVSLLGSRRLRDVLWVALAAAGIGLFAGLPTSGGLSAAGLLFAILAGAAWAGYIFTAQRVGRAWQGSQGLAAGMLASAVLLAPTGIARIGSVSLWSAAVICLLGILSAALPFSLEMSALRRLTARSYGVLASLEPAIATVVGVIALGQAPHASEAVATLLVVTASVGATVERAA
ncbi:MAG TPA: EamA family transporter [Gaiellales bacterium]